MIIKTLFSDKPKNWKLYSRQYGKLTLQSLFFVRLEKMLTYGAWYSAIIIHFLTSLNRFCVFKYPLSYSRIWTVKKTSVVGIICYCFGIFSSFPVFFGKWQFRELIRFWYYSSFFEMKWAWKENVEEKQSPTPLLALTRVTTGEILPELTQRTGNHEGPRLVLVTKLSLQKTTHWDSWWQRPIKSRFRRKPRSLVN